MSEERKLLGTYDAHLVLREETGRRFPRESIGYFIRRGELKGKKIRSRWFVYEDELKEFAKTLK